MVGIARSLPYAAWDTGVIETEQGREAVPDWPRAAVESDPLFPTYTGQIIYRAGTSDSARWVPGLLGRWQRAVASCSRVQRPRGHLASGIDPSISSRANTVSYISPSPPAPLPSFAQPPFFLQPRRPAWPPSLLAGAAAHLPPSTMHRCASPRPRPAALPTLLFPLSQPSESLNSLHTAKSKSCPKTQGATA